MKILALVLFVTFAVPVQADPALEGTWVFQKPRYCSNGSPINDLFFDALVMEAKMTFSGTEMKVDLTLAISDINQYPTCRVQNYYRYEKLSDYEAISADVLRTETTCAEILEPLDMVLPFRIEGDVLKFVEPMPSDSFTCSGTDLITIYKKVK